MVTAACWQYCNLLLWGSTTVHMSGTIPSLQDCLGDITWSHYQTGKRIDPLALGMPTKSLAYVWGNARATAPIDSSYSTVPECGSLPKFLSRYCIGPHLSMLPCFTFLGKAYDQWQGNAPGGPQVPHTKLVIHHPSTC